MAGGTWWGWCLAYFGKWVTSADRREKKVESQKESNSNAVYTGDKDAVNDRLNKLTRCVVIGVLLGAIGGCASSKMDYTPSCMEARPTTMDYELVTIPEDPNMPAVTNTVTMQGWFLPNARMEIILNTLEEAAAAKKRD